MNPISLLFLYPTFKGFKCYFTLSFQPWSSSVIFSLSPSLLLFIFNKKMPKKYKSNYKKNILKVCLPTIFIIKGSLWLENFCWWSNSGSKVAWRYQDLNSQPSGPQIFNIFPSGPKIPGSKTDINCRSEECLGQVRAHLYL